MKDLWVPLSGAIAQQKNVESIANNVANVNTPGFKKDQVVFKEHLTAHERGADIDLPNKEWAPEDFYRSYGAEKANVKVNGSFTDFAQGSLTPTGNPLDLALAGKGFFEILTKNGIRYTRSGRLNINPEGFLVNHSGDKVLAKVELPETGEGDGMTRAIAQLPDPSQRAIKLVPGNITVNEQGVIFSNERRIGRLGLTEFKDLHRLKKEGNSYFVNDNAKNIVADTPITVVRQGFVEGSNVNPILEMSKLIKAHRQFESIQKVIKAYDSMAGRAVNDISKF